jgi:N-acyl-D-aspartate/D-glutamate deacylase
VRALAAVIALFAIGSVMSAGQQDRYDVLIANARIIDGSGQPAREGDIAIRAGRIVAVGRVPSAPAGQRIDAAGLTVTPGFIDSHAHAGDMTQRPNAEASVASGITTVVAGTDGISAVDIGEALDDIAGVGLSVNYATFVGHSTVRTSVMGRTIKDPLLADLNRMKAIIFKALADGAIGLSTGLQSSPGRYARNSEIAALARVAGNVRGVYAAQVRTESFTLEQAVNESIRLAESLSLPVQLSGLIFDPARPAGTTAVIKLIDDAKRRNVDVWADQDVFPESDTLVNPEADRMLQHPMVMIASDHLRVISEKVLDRHVVSLEEAIRKMTSLPAARLGFAGRGLIKESAAADLVIFDPRRLSPAAAGAVRDVLVNGVLVRRNGQHTGERPGKVLRRTRGL